MEFPLILCLAVALDAILGDPRNFPHPVRLIGNLIDFCYNRLRNFVNSFLIGLAVMVITLVIAGLFVRILLYISGFNIAMKVYLLYSALAWRDLKDETRPVYQSLITHDIARARVYLSYVVGCDTKNLNETEIVRAVIETIAENSVDGVMSVIFFAAVGNALDPDYGACVCVWLFKAASTLDSMLGYESMGKFGTASARLDDVMNFIPARLGGLIIVLAGGNFRGALRVFMNDRLKHKSPNSAHGESAFAGVLGVRLGGGAYYGGKFEAREWLNEGGREPEVGDILRAWRVLDASCLLSIVLTIILSLHL